MSVFLGPHRAEAAADLQAELNRIFGAKREYEAKTFGPARWLKSGATYTTLEPSEDKSGRDIVAHDAVSGTRTILVTARALTPTSPAGAKPLSIDDYSWSDDGAWLLIFTDAKRVWRQKTRGDYWLLNRSDGSLRRLGGNAEPSSLQFAKFSPDSRRVAYVRANNVYVEDVRSGAIKQLTRDGSKTVINGTTDWVNEEELRLRDGFVWSDDSRSIAYLQYDTSNVGEFTLISSTQGLYPVLTRFPYPKAGTVNSAVRVGVVAATGGSTRWLDLPGDPRERYIARLTWAGQSDTLTIHELNRLQNQLQVWQANSRTGKVTRHFEDKDAAWISPLLQPLTTKDRRHLITLSERGGWQQAYAVSSTDGSVRLLTPQPADVTSLVATDATDTWLYYLASPANATQRYLYRTPLDGSGRSERITPADEPGTHAYTLSPDGQYAIHTVSSANVPPSTRLVRLPSHEAIRTLEANETLRQKTATLPTVEFFKVNISPDADLDGWMIKPPDFDAQKRHPVIVFIYGEPGSTTVNDTWGGSRNMFHRALAAAGYIVLSLDNRGTPAPRGREWRKRVYRQIGTSLVQDQTTALKNLIQQRPYLDASRIGVWGWSGGGTSTLQLLFRSPEVFHVGVAVAPVSDVHYYDTIYQERFLGLPSDNPEGYRDASPLAFADGLKGKLLLIHGAADDNVHYQNSERLINRLVELQKPFDVMVYPDGTHAINEGKGYSLHLYSLIARYLQTHLSAGGRLPSNTQASVLP